ncbi:hypothetical protein OGATHE_002425 [Ogataea polymorpha]|uniref:Uncharacterized protein n=1 Tax=Ogataea polymorpha TaxID=460523 RepID=A0A9P8PCA1_9ASCO|nr:hypothetical protein OGATHE_002425 [Ogataea polymorpha]
MFQPAYQPKAPCALNAFSIDGHVKDRMKLKNQQVAVAKDIVTSLTLSEAHSAEYVNGTGPSDEDKQQQCSTAKLVNGKEGWQCKHPVEHTKSPGSNKRVSDRESRVTEDRGRIVCNNIDTAELLHEHTDPGTDSTISVSSDSDHFLDFCEEGCFHVSFLKKQKMTVEGVSSRLQRSVSHLDERLEGVTVSSFTQEPSWRFGTEWNLRKNYDRRQTSRTQHQTPLKTFGDPAIWHLVEGKSKDISQHDSKRSPDLPVHHQRASDFGWSTLGGVNGNSGRVRTNSEA